MIHVIPHDNRVTIASFHFQVELQLRLKFPAVAIENRRTRSFSAAVLRPVQRVLSQDYKVRTDAEDAFYSPILMHTNIELEKTKKSEK